MTTYELPNQHLAAWGAATFADNTDYCIELDQHERNEIILAAVNAIDSRTPPVPVHDLGREAFAFSELGQRLRSAFDQVRSGRGFVVLRGLPTDAFTLEQFVTAVWGIGTWFGSALSQNAQGQLIDYVIDASQEEATPRLYRSSQELRLHSDITAMVSLACWQPSQSGGLSALASGYRIHQDIARQSLHLLEPLYQGFHYHRLGEEGSDEEPVTPFRVPVFASINDQLSCRYQRIGIAAGHHELGLDLSELELEALDTFEQVAQSEAVRFEFALQRGDMLIVNNYTVLHARTHFVDSAEPEQRRRLVRMWLDAENFRAVPEAFNHFSGNGVPPQEGRSCSYDFKKLYREAPVLSGATRLKLSAEQNQVASAS